MRGLLLTNDLMFSSRIVGAAQASGRPMAVVMSVDALPERLAGGDVALVIIDLAAMPIELASLVETIRTAAPAAHIVAYGPHVDELALDAARAAGCHRVLSRGQFVQELPAILHDALKVES